MKNPTGPGLADLELSVVMPCLNEADTLRTCIRKAQAAMREAGIVGEVIVADNGSDDGSREIAEGLGARVVRVTDRGYGARVSSARARRRAGDSARGQELHPDVATGCSLRGGAPFGRLSNP
ncbi:MAG: glycosyltransferase, partial [Gemmatimonadota bacterium]